jgi:sterol desaturase/sphingolipid hydroxylase (fatty acid hydroxylase superfamily)
MPDRPLFSACWHNISHSFQAVASVIQPFPTIANSISLTPTMPALGTWWSWLCQRYSPWQVELVVTVFVQLIGFWLPATVYQLVDICFPEFSKAHKHQPEPHRQPTRAEIVNCIRYAVFVTLADITLQIGLGYLTDFRPIFVITSTLPTFKEMVRHFVWGNIAHEVLAYYVHRILHLPRFYARYHKLHHSFTAPIAFTGLYSSPAEHFFADIIPTLLPLALVARYYEPVHILSFNCFLMSVLFVGTAEHSGYDFAQPPGSKMHDLHHEKSNVHYGSLHFMDWLHGTNVPKWHRSRVVEGRMKEVGSKA